MALLVWIALACGVLWFVCSRNLSEEWRFNEQYSYGWFVPFFATYLFWLRWQDRPARSLVRPLGVRLAIALIIISALLLLPLRVFEIANSDYRPLGWLHALAAAAVSLGFIYLFGGRSWLRHFAFPVLFFLTAVPWITAIEAPVIEGLMRAIAGLAAETLSLCGVPAEAQGNLLRLPSGVVGVNEACSGVRSLQTSIMIGLLFGELRRLRPSRRVWLVVGAIAIALFANFVRVLFLVSVASSAHDISAVSRWHDPAAYTILLLVFAGTMWMAWCFDRKPEPATGHPRKVRATRQRDVAGEYAPRVRALQRVACSLLIWMLAVEFAAEMWYRAHEYNLAASPAWSIRWPLNGKAYREIKPDDRVRQLLRYDWGREAAWRRTDRAETDYVFFFRWNPGSGTILRARAHRPDICLPSAGWTQIGRDKIKHFEVSGGRELPFRYFTFANEGSLRAHAYYCLHEDRVHGVEGKVNDDAGLYSNWDLRDRWRVVREGIRNLGQQVMEVIIVTPTNVSDVAVDQSFSELLKQTVDS
ncbi:MAG: exosortase/archaeosortase family protein [Verrucomicrobia bacterium]|nr:exosortase/archaeosortase family protein [Verrucomicrobiota bacterium]